MVGFDHSGGAQSPGPENDGSGGFSDTETDSVPDWVVDAGRLKAGRIQEIVEATSPNGLSMADGFLLNSSGLTLSNASKLLLVFFEEWRNA